LHARKQNDEDRDDNDDDDDDDDDDEIDGTKIQTRPVQWMQNVGLK